MRRIDQESARTAMHCMERARDALGEDRIAWLRLAASYVEKARSAAGTGPFITGTGRFAAQVVRSRVARA